MTPKPLSPKEVKELIAQNEQLSARLQELEKKIAEMSAQQQAAPVAQPSKSRTQAEKALELLKAGPVSTSMLKEINEKYPSDPIYFVRTVLKVKVYTHKTKDGTFYSLEEAKPAEKSATA